MNRFRDDEQRRIGELRVFSYPQVDSTNTEAKRRLLAGEMPPFVVTADEQSAGRGRQGKSFFSPYGGVYLSVALPAQKLDGCHLTAYAAVATARALDCYTESSCLIKWVNDLYQDGKKVCGILCEAVRNPKTLALCGIIVGIGINLALPMTDDELQNKAGSLKIAPNKTVDRERLIGEIITSLAAYQPDDIRFMEEYRNRSCVIGKKITFIENGERYLATVKTVTDQGALSVITPQGERLLSSGEISLLL